MREHHDSKKVSQADLDAGPVTVEKPHISKIYGRIQYVDQFPDYRVEVVSGYEDLAVQEVRSLPNGPGLWQIVDTFPDYRIQIVDASCDFKVRFVESFPGSKKKVEKTIEHA